MRRALIAAATALALALVVTTTGCPAGHDDYPGTSCMNDNDCFKGEHCMNNTICVADVVDMAVQLPPIPRPDMAQELDMTGAGGDM